MFGADHGHDGYQRADPVRHVDDVRAGDAGEEILVPAAEADDFVREDRPADDELIVIVNQLVDRDIHFLSQQAVGDTADLLGGDVADSLQRPGLVPLVVEDADDLVLPLPLRGRDAHQLVDRLTAHGHVGAERDKIIELLDLLRKQFVEELEEERQRRRAGAVGDDDEYAFAGQAGACQPLSQHLPHFGILQGASLSINANDHVCIPFARGTVQFRPARRDGQ